MLIGITIVCIALSLLIVRDPSASWRMFSSWWRKAEATPNTEKANGSLSDEQKTSAVETDDGSDGESTPKALPKSNGVSVPTFSLEEPESRSAAAFDSDSDDEDNMLPPQFPSLNSAQRASGGRGTISSVPTPSFNAPSTPSNGMMLPPPRPPVPSLRAPSLSAPSLSPGGLRIPSSGPLPNRGPPQAFNSLSVPLTTSVLPPNPRKKITLSPGHSPLDWANLQRIHPNLSGVPSFQRVTPSMLKANNGRKGRQAWSSFQGKVYNITPYLPFHPGGEGELRRAAGKDGEKLFMEIHPWVNWDNMLGQCIVGIMVSENDPRAGFGSPLDEMD